MTPTINHTAIQGRPVIDIIKEQNRPFAISYGKTAKHKTCVKYSKVYQQDFPISRIINDYFHHYGHDKATKILISKGIINSEFRPIIFKP